jgi:hypothetical protein
MWEKSGTPLLGAVALGAADATGGGVAVAADGRVAVDVAVAVLGTVADGAGVAVEDALEVAGACLAEPPQLVVSMASNARIASILACVVERLARVLACNTSRAFR